MFFSYMLIYTKFFSFLLLGFYGLWEKIIVFNFKGMENKEIVYLLYFFKIFILFLKKL